MSQFSELRAANKLRNQEWDPYGMITALFRATEMAGEAGEVCNVIKKLERERMGLRGSMVSIGQLIEELADVVICTDLIAMHYGIDLYAAVVDKFNKTSTENGLEIRIGCS